MKEVGDKFGAGELILPFVLQSAEVMKRAVARLETYLERLEGQAKGTVVLATVFGDVHDIGKNLVHTILANNGSAVHDLGKQVPVNDIIARAEEVGADAIGLSALLVSTSRQMPACVQELQARGLRFPVLCGGAAINPSFIRRAAFLDPEQGTLEPATAAIYEPGVWYCRDAFAGLDAVDALVDPERREAFRADRLQEIREGTARREALKAKAAASAPAEVDGGPSGDVDVPTPAFTGVKVIDRIPPAELFELIDLNTLYRLHWGAKNAKGEVWERLVREEYEPRLRRYQQDALAGGWLRTRGAYGFFPAASHDDALVVFDPQDPRRERARFDFPRQPGRERLCLADYFRSANGAAGAPDIAGASEVAGGAPDVALGARDVPGGARDIVGFQIVTVGDALLKRSEELMASGDYAEGYYLHGFGVRLAEAAAEWLHRRMRAELGIAPDRGLRYSRGYPACPDHLQHFRLFELLPARERLGLDLTEAGALVPELTTAALVVHHPEAKYFSAEDDR
jgi:5-methyltetrahydrofolate--homocysteine methyltransferase